MIKSVEEVIFRLHKNLMEKQGIHEVSSREIGIRPKILDKRMNWTLNWIFILP